MNISSSFQTYFFTRYILGELSIKPWAEVKKLLVSMAVPPAPVRVPSQRLLVPSFASVTSVANDKEVPLFKV